MKIVLILCLLVAYVACQSAQSHFGIQGAQNNRNQQPGSFQNRQFSSGGRSIDQQETSPNRFGSSQGQFGSSQGQFGSSQGQFGSSQGQFGNTQGQNQFRSQNQFGSSGSDRSQSRFQTSQRGQQVLPQQNRQTQQSFQRTSNPQNHFQISGQRQQQQQQQQHQQQVTNNQRRPTQSSRPQSRPQSSSGSRGSSSSSGSVSSPSKPAADSGRLLTLPEADLCANRPKQWKFGNHHYYFSWDQDVRVDPVSGKPIKEKVDWLKARNECRKRCMDAIGIESEAENKMVVKFLKENNVKYVWTSGRLCDFTGCNERKDLHPVSVFGWFWSNTNTKAAPTNSTPPGWVEQPWSDKGHTGGPQPDNAEFSINKTPESCLAVLNNIYKDGVKWHDIACYHKKPYICEDSDLLLNFIGQTNKGLVL